MGAGKAHVSQAVEEWNAFRENLVWQFRFNRKTVSTILVFGVAVPLLAYRFAKAEQATQDAQRGQPTKYL
jgi:hypothetical protein